MAVKVYVVSDPLAINFIDDDDIDGFKEYLESDEYLDFGQPTVFDTEQQALAFCTGLGCFGHGCSGCKYAAIPDSREFLG